MNLHERLSNPDSDAELIRAALQASALIRDIHAVLDGSEWGSWTTYRIAELLEGAGYTIRPSYVELFNYMVTYYEKGGGENALEFFCGAPDEEDAVDQCHAAYPGCVTTNVEEVE